MDVWEAGGRAAMLVSSPSKLLNRDTKYKEERNHEKRWTANIRKKNMKRTLTMAETVPKMLRLLVALRLIPPPSLRIPESVHPPCRRIHHPGQLF